MKENHLNVYKSLSDKMLFQYNMVHTTRKNDVFADEPVLIDETLARKFRDSGEVLNRLVEKIIRGINDDFQDLKPYIPEFKFKDEIIALKRELPETLWVRYDGFIRESGIFYSELNYDKPCAQRECSFNSRFEKAFGDGFDYDIKEIFTRICDKEVSKKDKINIAFLTAPSRYEETHLAIYLKDILEDNKHSFILAGPDNFNVVGDKAYVFNQEVDVIIRLYPTEYLYEVRDFEKLLRLHDEKKVLILNDPRVIIGQCKSLYAFLWGLVENEDSRLSEAEVLVIKAVLPETELLKTSNLDKALKDKNKYVIKPVFGRYSIDVFIGSLHTEEEWKDSIEYVKEHMENKPFILQEFCEIEAQTAPYYDENFSYDVQAFGNYGVFLSGGKFIGSCIRWNDDYLTEEESTWISAVAIGKSLPIEVVNPEIDLKAISREALIEYGFTGSYVKNYEYLSSEIITIEEERFEELKAATEKLASVFKKTARLIYSNLELYGELLGIENLKEIISKEFTEELTFIGRMDWILDKYGNFKLLELNAETPAGICESIVVDKLYYESILSKHQENLKLKRINGGLDSLIREQFYNILKDLKKRTDIQRVAIVSATYYEDWYTINSIYEILKNEGSEEKKELDIDIIMGSIYDIVVDNDNCYLYGKKIDCFYRFYPLDWFVNPEYEMEQVGNLINKSVFSINPTWSIIPQSKGFFSAIYELLKYDFYDKFEKKLIKKYIPYTTFDPSTLRNRNYIVKPLLGREGQDIKLSYELEELPEYDCVFQQAIKGATLNFTVKSNVGSWKENLYPIIGTYVVGEKFGGVYTRVGSKITNNICMYSPLYVKEEEKAGWLNE